MFVAHNHVVKLYMYANYNNDGFKFEKKKSLIYKKTNLNYVVAIFKNNTRYAHFTITRIGEVEERCVSHEKVGQTEPATKNASGRSSGCVLRERPVA